LKLLSAKLYFNNFFNHSLVVKRQLTYLLNQYFVIFKRNLSDGNGSNDYFDLRLMDVRKLQIFDRYGIKVK
jgi:hypothetical protein